ncbi:unnamed protein product [Phyllotreta striolata]|uniref:Cellulase n=1 Tax=Phyllotreta striolata TaxID=444603 RepID=A0A9N9TG40_PHYSR|nr:unnamed protein product [Phyllotreta striolata]
MKAFAIIFCIASISSYVNSSAIGNESPQIIPMPNGVSGDGITTRYWDCCAPSCAYYGYLPAGMHPVQTCQKDGYTNSTEENNAQSGCQAGGVAYTCSNQIPYLKNATLAYGWAAASFTGGLDYSQCCSCFLLSFKGRLTGKKFLVQNVNTGPYLATNQFDLQIPGGGVGLYNLGCMTQWNTSEDGWGDRITGVKDEEQCKILPEVLQPGCRFRFEYMEGIDNPDVSFEQVKCPAELVAVSGCGSTN